jgi:hypothetical protein
MRSWRDGRSLCAFGCRDEGHGFIEPSQALSWRQAVKFRVAVEVAWFGAAHGLEICNRGV